MRPLRLSLAIAAAVALLPSTGSAQCCPDYAAQQTVGYYYQTPYGYVYVPEGAAMERPGERESHSSKSKATSKSRSTSSKKAASSSKSSSSKKPTTTASASKSKTTHYTGSYQVSSDSKEEKTEREGNPPPRSNGNKKLEPLDGSEAAADMHDHSSSTHDAAMPASSTTKPLPNPRAY